MSLRDFLFKASIVYTILATIVGAIFFGVLGAFIGAIEFEIVLMIDTIIQDYFIDIEGDLKDK